jgi:hypothetical protein
VKGSYFARDDDTVRIAFEDGPLAGEWIQVRAAISKAQEQRLYGGMLTGFREDAREDGSKRRVMEADATSYEVNRLRFWVRRWSLGTDDERGMRPTPDQLDTLLPEFADEILAALDKHETARKAEEPELRHDPLVTSSETPTETSPTHARRSSGKPSAVHLVSDSTESD